MFLLSQQLAQSRTHTHAHTGQTEQGQGEGGSLSLNLCYFSVPARDKDCRIMSNVLCACALHCFTYLLCLFMHSLLAFPPPLPLFPSLLPSLCLHKLLLLTVLNYRSFCICMFDKLFARHSQSVSGRAEVKVARDTACPSASSDGFQNPLTNAQQLSEQGQLEKREIETRT